MADSKQPVVEKVQQLPQGPYMRKGRGTALGGAAGSPKHWGTGAWQRAEPALPAGSWAWLSAQPLPRARGRHRMAQGELPWGRGSQHCSLPTATNHRTSLTWFFTGVTKFPFFLQSMESGEGPELRRKLPLVAEQFCKPGRGCVGCCGPQQPPPRVGIGEQPPHTLGTAAGAPGHSTPGCSGSCQQKGQLSWSQDKS